MATIDLREGILRHCFDPNDPKRGDERNVPDISRLRRLPELAALAVTQVAGLARWYNPDLIVSASDRVQWLGRAVGRTLGIDVLLLGSDPETKSPTFPSQLRDMYAPKHRLVMVEDVIGGPSVDIYKALAHPDIEGRVEAVVGIWDMHSDRSTTHPSCEAVYNQPGLPELSTVIRLDLASINAQSPFV